MVGERRNGLVSPPCAVAAIAAVTLLCAPRAGAAGRYIDDIRVVRSGRDATVEIDLACPMRLVSEVQTAAGTVAEIHLRPDERCRGLGIDDLASEAYRPVGRDLADLLQVEYESLGVGESFVLLRFDRRVDYRTKQGGNLRTLEIAVHLPADGPEEPREPPTLSATEPAPTAPRRVQRETPRPRPAAGRTPLTPRVRAPETTADYIVNLESTHAPVSQALIESLAVPAGRRVYVSTIEVDGQTWHRLRLGFFASEAEAREALDALSGEFQRAWIGRAEPAEIRSVANGELEPGGVFDATATAESSTSAAAAEEAPAPGQPPLSKERAAALLDEARAATLDGDHEQAIGIYKELLSSPGEHRAEARELLGVAYEKTNQLALAQAQYRRYLELYPGSDAAPRVRQRLNSLLTRSVDTAEPRPRLAATAEARASVDRAEWDVATSISQYYRRDAVQLGQDQERIPTQSSLISDLDLSVARTGGRLDLLGRVTVNHLHDGLGEDANGPGDQSRLYQAYVDLDAVEGDWSLRLGRQSLHHWGVLGRFDGAHFIYDWAPNRRVRFTSGYPVESPRKSLDSARRFEGVAVDFDELVGSWDLSAFLQRQTIAGIADREAVGLEMDYVGERRRLTSIVDYDTGYGQLNSLIALGTWRLPSRVTLSAMLDMRMSPILTTRNALIGQGLESMEQLLLEYSEDEIRQLALDRTAESRSTTLGVAAPLGERFQINADMTLAQLDGTRASGGVPAVPAVGTQTTYSMSLVGSSLFGGHDVNVFNVRQSDSDTFSTSQITWDARFPLGGRWRINPRLQVARWQSALDGRQRETVSPSLRLLMNLRNRYRFELELGTDERKRTAPGVADDSTSGYFFELGYRANF